MRTTVRALAAALAFAFFARPAAADAPSIQASVTPPVARFCAARASDAASAAVCSACAGGDCRLSIPEAWREDDLRIEVSADDHFSETRLARAGEKMEFRLVSHPWIDWKGWLGPESPEADMDWLPADRSDQWRPLGKKLGRGKRFLPGDARALRVSHGGAGSPVTFFPSGSRAPFGTQGPLPLTSGGEVALCLEVDKEKKPAAGVLLVLRPERAGKGSEQSRTTSSAGCASFPGLKPGLVVVTTGSDSRLRLAPIAARVVAGRSEWLGTLSVSVPATVTIRIEDPDTTHAYAVRIETANPLDPSARSEKGTVTSARPAVWNLPPADYMVWLRPSFLSASESMEIVSLRAGENQAILFHPHFIRLSGRASRGDAPLVDAPLHFEREEESGREHSLYVRTDGEGRYAAALGSGGRWRVSLREPGEPGGSSRALRIDVPDEPEAERDIAFPGGAISGRVLDRKTGKPVEMCAVEVRVIPAGEGNESKAFELDVRADAQGRFHVEALPEARVSVGISEAFALVFRIRPVDPVVVEVRGGEPQSVELLTDPLEDGKKLRVVDSAGAPVSGAQAYGVSTAPMSAAPLGHADETGEIVLPKDLPAMAPIYILCPGRPWLKTYAPAESENERGVRLEDPRREPLVLEFQPPEGRKAPREILWGLSDSAGLDVPVFYHLIRQGVLPVAQGGMATIPQPGDGEYTLWVKANHGYHVLGRIVLPAASPVIASLKPCGEDCSGP